ncbi:hypothetical protein SUDANB23_06589 (plasmid) [Streptomyces sp. enrichment culture]
MDMRHPHLVSAVHALLTAFGQDRERGPGDVHDDVLQFLAQLIQLMFGDSERAQPLPVTVLDALSHALASHRHVVHALTSAEDGALIARHHIRPSARWSEQAGRRTTSSPPGPRYTSHRGARVTDDADRFERAVTATRLVADPWSLAYASRGCAVRTDAPLSQLSAGAPCGRCPSRMRTSPTPGRSTTTSAHPTAGSGIRRWAALPPRRTAPPRGCCSRRTDRLRCSNGGSRRGRNRRRTQPPPASGRQLRPSWPSRDSRSWKSPPPMTRQRSPSRNCSPHGVPSRRRTAPPTNPRCFLDLRQQPEA